MECAKTSLHPWVALHVPSIPRNCSGTSGSGVVGSCDCWCSKCCKLDQSNIWYLLMQSTHLLQTLHWVYVFRTCFLNLINPVGQQGKNAIFLHGTWGNSPALIYGQGGSFGELALYPVHMWGEAWVFLRIDFIYKINQIRLDVWYALIRRMWSDMYFGGSTCYVVFIVCICIYELIYY